MFKKNILFIFAILFTSQLFAQNTQEEKYIKYPTAGKPEKITDRKGKLRVSATAMQGYDNNANLSPAKKGDFFQEAIFNVDYRYKYSQKTNIGAYFNSTNIVYDNFTGNTLFDNIFKVDWTRKIFKFLTFQKIYQLEYLYFPKSDTSSYVKNNLGFSLRHDVYRGLFHAFKYNYSVYNYTLEKRDFASGFTSDKKRFDMRNTVLYEIGCNFNKALVKIGYQYYKNDSNYLYRNYYDYYVNRGILSAGYNFTDKFFVFSNFSFFKRRYQNRIQIDGNNSPEVDNLYLFNLSLNYNLTKYLSAMLDFSYRDNNSNVSSQEYSGSLTTLGLNYTF